MNIAELLRKAYIIRRGSVQLKGGATSDFYIDVKAGFGNPAILHACAKGIAARIPQNATCIAAGGYGGLPLGSAVSLLARLPLVMVREKPKTHGRAVMLDGYVPKRGDKIVLVDDVYTSGTSMRQIEQVVRTTGARVIGRFVVVNRSGKRIRGITSLASAREIVS